MQREETPDCDVTPDCKVTPDRDVTPDRKVTPDCDVTAADRGGKQNDMEKRIKEEVILEEEHSSPKSKGKKVGKKSGDDSSSDEPVILKVKKATDVSIRKSLRIQKQKSEQRKKLQELEDKRGKRLAAKFIISQSSVTYQPPVGYYGPFGVQDKMVKGDSPKEDSNIIGIDDDDDACIVDDVSNRTKPLK